MISCQTQRSTIHAKTQFLSLRTLTGILNSQPGVSWTKSGCGSQLGAPNLKRSWILWLLLKIENRPTLPASLDNVCNPLSFWWSCSASCDTALLGVGWPCYDGNSNQHDLGYNHCDSGCISTYYPLITGTPQEVSELHSWYGSCLGSSRPLDGFLQHLQQLLQPRCGRPVVPYINPMVWGSLTVVYTIHVSKDKPMICYVLLCKLGNVYGLGFYGLGFTPSVLMWGFWWNTKTLGCQSQQNLGWQWKQVSLHSSPSYTAIHLPTEV